MKQLAVFFLVIIALLLSGSIDETFPQEKEGHSETQIKDRELKSEVTTTIIEHKKQFTTTIITQTPPTGEVIEQSGEEKKTLVEKKQSESTKEPEFLKNELSEKEKAEVDDWKSRFKKLIEDEMEKFGALKEPESEEEKEVEGKEEKEEKGEAPEELKKAAEGREVQKEVALEEGEEKVIPELKESKEVFEEEEETVVEEIEEEVLEEDKLKEIVEAPPAEPEKPEEGKQKIALDFEDADLKEVITALADIVGINYIVDPKVRGKVNIHTSGEISVEDIFPILETIFEVNNVTAVKVGDIYKIIPVKEAKKQPLFPQIGKELEDISSPDRLVLQIIPLRYIAPKEMEKILKKFLGRGGEIVDYPDRNILIIIDTTSNMKKLLSLIDTVDVSIFETMHVRFYEIEESEAEELAKELENLFKAMGIETKKKKGGELVSFIPIERLNIILAVSSMPEIFDKVAEWVEKLDGVSEELEEQIFVYFVENAKAVDIGDIIKELYGERRREKTTRKTRTTKKSKKTKPSSRVKKTKTGSSTVIGEVKIVIDEVNNAILVRATPQDYAQVLKTIKLLDTIPKQVLIEVLIAEVTLDEGSEFGIEWAYKSDYASLGGYKGTESMGQNIDIVKGLSPSGFTYAFVSDALESYLRAYAREAEVDILFTPHILVADNTEARIEVGKEVPIVTSEYTPTTLEAGETYSRSIEYRDTGILLTVTPRINEKGLVAMEVSQEVSDVSEQRIEGINSPIILKRQAETTLVVQDGKTIAIGGLIRDKKDNAVEGIPFLSKLPYLGMLFGYTKEVIEKTELLMLITPHVVHTFEEAELITRELEEKVESLKKILGK